MRTSLIKILAVLTIVSSTGSSAFALPPWKPKFKQMFVDDGPKSLQDAFADKVIGSCKVCHVNGKEKTVRNPFGQALDRLIEGSAGKRLKTAAKIDDDAKVATQAKIDKEFLQALDRVLGLQSPSGGGTYGARIKAGKLPFVPSSADESRLVAPGAKVVKLAEGFDFTEGPARDTDGNIYFSDIPNNRIHKWSLDGKLSTFREQSGGANGLFFDRQGNLLCCEGRARRLTSVSADGRVTELASRYNGKRLNSPNDLWIDPQGGVYFTDPRYGNMDGLEQGGFHVYYLSADRKRLTRVIDDLVKPNGIVGNADGKLLYVADPGDNKSYVFHIQSDASLSNRRQIAPEGSDGMTLDERGNLYLTRAGVHVYSPQGKRIAVIETPERPANICFGGKDRRTLFITAQKGFYSVRMAVQGQ